jgi:hypothetical protein
MGKVTANFYAAGIMYLGREVARGALGSCWVRRLHSVAKEVWKYEDALFTDFGGVSRVSRVMKTPGKVNTFMEQEP